MLRDSNLASESDVEPFIKEITEILKVMSVARKNTKK